jgi:protein-tyrosine-phosphatase
MVLNPTTANLQPPDFLRLFGHNLRWQIVSALARSDLRVQEIVGLLQQPQNLVSYHLRQLRDSRVVSEHRSIADGREVYYSLDLPQVQRMYFASGEALHPALNPNPLDEATSESGPPTRVLFLCTHNSARSQIAEGLLRARGGEIIEVHSAGTEATRVHPLAVQAMQAQGFDISSHRSKTLDQFIGQDFDYIITVCDQAREACPIFPGDPVHIHWSFPDPSAVEGSPEVRYKAFEETTIQMMGRISFLLTMIQRQRAGG